MKSLKTLSCLFLLLLVANSAAQTFEKKTVLGTSFRVDPVFEPLLEKSIERLRSVIRVRREFGKLIGFVSIPLSSRGGGNRDLNVEISEHIKANLDKRFGERHFWALAPGLVESHLPSVEGRSARGGEYMYMWTEVLAGEKGLGEDFDLVYFSGPSDFGDFFGFTGQNDLQKLEEFMNNRADQNPDFAQTVSTPEARQAFLRYYAMKASVTFSSGSHDEWNLFRKVNQRRRKELGVGDQLPLYFDGRQLSPTEAEAPVSKGYELAGTPGLFEHLQSLEGQAFAGRMTYPEDPDHKMNKPMRIEVNRISDSELRIPLHVGEDRSRTWILRKQTSGVQLKHDHRHADGTPDEVTNYGGHSRSPGLGSLLIFPADEETATLLPEASTNVWTLRLSPNGRSLTYYLERHSQPRFEAVFDLSKPLR
jgi:hypothetical protein